MKACTIFLLLAAFAYTNSTPSTKSKINERSANLTQKSKVTSKSASLHKIAVGDTNIPIETFTGFIEDLVIILNTYNDDIFEDFVHIVDKAIKKYPYKGQNEFKKVLTEKSNLLLQKPVHAKRAVINQIVDMMRLLKRFDDNVKELLDYVDSLYKDKAREKFRKILTDLKGYKAGYGKTRTKDNFTKIIRNSLKATVFIQTNLNTDVKQKLGKHIETFLKKYKEFWSSSSSTTETATPVLFYMTTEKPRIVYKSESKSKLVEKMLEEDFRETQTTRESIATPGNRLTSKHDLGTSTTLKIFKTHGKNQKATKNYLRSSTRLLPSEDPSKEIFNKEKSRKEKLSHKRKNKFTPTGHSELKKHIHSLRHHKTANDIKSLHEITRNNKTHKDIENNSIDDDESKEKKPSNITKDRKNFKKCSKSNEHDAEDQSKTTEESDTEEDVETTSSVSQDEQDSDRSVRAVENDDIYHSHKLKNKKKGRNTNSKNTEIKESTSAETATEDSIQETEDITNEISVQTYSKVVEAFPLLFKGDKLQEGMYPANLWD